MVQSNLRIRTCEKEELDFSQVLRLALDTFTRNGLISPLMTSDHVRQILEVMWKGSDHMIIAEESNRLSGFLSIKYAGDGHAHFASWMPYLRNGTNAFQLAPQLINAGIRIAKEKGSRMAWTRFDLLPGRERGYSDYSSWYRSCGFAEPFQTPGFIRPLQRFSSFDFHRLMPSAYTSGLDIKPLNDIDFQQVFDIYCKAFSSCRDNEFHLRTGPENRETLMNREGREYQIPEASLALTDGETLVGFANLYFLKDRPNLANLCPIAIDPDYQRRGLGTLLLSKSMEVLSAKGYQALTLFVDAENASAIRFYGRLGFKEAFRLYIHTLELS